MSRYLTLTGLIVLSGIALSPRAALAEPPSYLTVFPHATHAGNNVYVSGANLKPNQRIGIIWACPDWGGSFVHHNNGLLQGPRTDEHGDFVGFPLKAQLNGVSYSTCQLYVTYPELDKSEWGVCYPFCPDIPGQYAITNAPLKKCDRQICAKITPHPQVVSAGLKEGISIKGGWGGATAHLTLLFQHPSGTIKLKPVTLDWNGRQHVSVFVDPKYAHAGKVTIMASFKLGQAKGNDRATFTVRR